MDDQKRARQQATLARLDRFSRFTDSSIRIPFTRFELGAEALIGLVPVIGDAAGLVLSGGGRCHGKHFPTALRVLLLLPDRRLHVLRCAPMQCR